MNLPQSQSCITPTMKRYVRCSCKFQIIIVLFLSRITSANPFPFSSSNSGFNNRKPPPPLPTSTDPHIILNLRKMGASKTDIKRAYHEAAMIYHPDVRINATSTREERELANEEFARINAAYQFLMGKGPTPKSPKSNTGEKRATNVKRGPFDGREQQQNSKTSPSWHAYSQQVGHRGARSSANSNSTWKTSKANYARVKVNTNSVGRAYQSSANNKNNVKQQRPNAMNFSSDFFDAEKFHARYSSSNVGADLGSSTKVKNDATYTTKGKNGETGTRGSTGTASANTNKGDTSARPATDQKKQSNARTYYTNTNAQKHGSQFGDFYDAGSFHSRIHENIKAPWKNKSGRTNSETTPAKSPFSHAKEVQRSRPKPSTQRKPGTKTSKQKEDPRFGYTSANFGDFFDADKFHARYNPTNSGIMQGEYGKDSGTSSSASQPVSNVGNMQNSTSTNVTAANPYYVSPSPSPSHPATASSLSFVGDFNHTKGSTPQNSKGANTIDSLRSSSSVASSTPSTVASSQHSASTTSTFFSDTINNRSAPSPSSATTSSTLNSGSNSPKSSSTTYTFMSSTNNVSASSKTNNINSNNGYVSPDAGFGRSIDRVDTYGEERYSNQYLSSQQMKGWNSKDSDVVVRGESSSVSHHVASHGSGGTRSTANEKTVTGSQKDSSNYCHEYKYTISNYHVNNPAADIKKSISMNSEVDQGLQQRTQRNKDNIAKDVGANGSQHRTQKKVSEPAATEQQRKYGDFFDAESFHAKWNAGANSSKP